MKNVTPVTFETLTPVLVLPRLSVLELKVHTEQTDGRTIVTHNTAYLPHRNNFHVRD